MAEKQPSRFLALLRGINVGGKNIIAKDDLRKCFEKMGFSSVRTYIQSGNVIFESDLSKIAELTDIVEEALSKRFKYEAQAVVLSRRKYQTAISSAPPTWGNNDDHKHNAMFTLRTTTPAKVLNLLPDPKPEIDIVTTGPGVIFWSVSKKGLTKSTAMKLAKHRTYQQMTVRNHNTVFKLRDMLCDR